MQNLSSITFYLVVRWEKANLSPSPAQDKAQTKTYAISYCHKNI